MVVDLIVVRNYDVCVVLLKFGMVQVFGGGLKTCGIDASGSLWIYSGAGGDVQTFVDG